MFKYNFLSGNKKYILLLILFLLTAFPSVFFFIKYRESEQKLKSVLGTSSEKNSKIIEAVGKLITLPEGETPTIATVTDKDKLNNQAFFQSAKNGDILLIYSQAKKAILYDPLARKIIDVAPLSVSTPSPSVSLSGPTATIAPVSLILLNGTNTTGLTRKYETEIRKKIANATILDRDNAIKRDYPKTLLIDLDNNQSEIARELSRELGIFQSDLPIEESASGSADFLIIVGADQN